MYEIRSGVEYPLPYCVGVVNSIRLMDPSQVDSEFGMLNERDARFYPHIDQMFSGRFS